MRRRAKVDSNHSEIVQALRAIGASVQSLAAVGKGCPDALIGFRGKNVLFEFKQPDVKTLRTDQQDWHRKWAGQVKTVHSADEAIIWLLDITGGR